MLSLTKLLTGDTYYGDDLRYTAASRNAVNGVAEGRGPVVSWNYTRTCNLKCRHCYSSSEAKRYDNELTTEEAKAFIDDLAEFKVPVILFSGGEPLIRPDFFELAAHAREKGIRATLSTNGTLITPEVAQKIKDHGIGYVGISIDGVREVNDEFRGVKGAYDAAIAGIRNCRAVGQRVGLRFTLNKANSAYVSDILDLLETEDIDRVCFYHLVYSGRGEAIKHDDLTHEETRQVLDLIAERVIDFDRRGIKKEVLMVDNHADGPYLYLKYRKKDPERARHIYRLLQINGGNRSGIAFSNVDNQGNVHPDQFTQHHDLGNVRERKFSEIWCDASIPLLGGLKDRKELLDEKCRKCSWLNICNGNFRARGEAVTGDFWGFDPACYLTEEERRIPAPAEGEGL
ncbi:MAG: putative heme d1 biosynthesis radical SAM protein NirJ1 [Eubacteriales bacterium]|nr:putative heme d1 biosynthesis radical SAM protein NirJ1 [Eubacteriales bacterium]